MTYKELFFNKFANNRGNIRKGTKALEVWDSMEEFLRLILTPKTKENKKEIPKSKTWSRKGTCPNCGVHTGSNHKTECIYKLNKTNEKRDSKPL
jgi:hypothetical protein